MTSFLNTLNLLAISLDSTAEMSFDDNLICDSKLNSSTPVNRNLFIKVVFVDIKDVILSIGSKEVSSITIISLLSPPPITVVIKFF